MLWPCRSLRSLLATLICSAATLPAFAISRIDIHIGEIRHPAAQIANLTATLGADERWQGKAELKHGDLAGLAKDYALPVTVSKGVVEGQARFSGEGEALMALNASATLREVAFSDAAGLHAGEKIAANLSLGMEREDGRWQWQGTLKWLEGEVFWQPLYIASGGHSFKGSGLISSGALSVERGDVELGGIGRMVFSGRMKLPEKSVESLEIDGRNLQVAKGYELLLKPFLEKSLLGNLEAAGTMDVRAGFAQGHLNSFRVDLHDLDLEDKGGRFALYKVNASVPWALNSATGAVMRFDGGKMLKMDLGAADFSARLDGWSLVAPEIRLPVLDGALRFSDVSAALVGGKWHWHLAANLEPVSMSAFSHAAGWPHMEGKIVASIPMVTYSGSRLDVDGAMHFSAFDGLFSIDNLELTDPMGLAPRLNADIRMRNFDLDLLTRTFSFGAMTGRLDGDIKGLELSSWKPVKFDAGVRSAEGRYPRKISQRAVENISALGGAGAAAAIQRSFLKFFKEFNYDRIGLSCRLRNGVCAMDGVEKAQSGYVIVKGSGIPAVTVLGYNRNVSWTELLDRLRSVTQGNSRPVIK